MVTLSWLFFPSFLFHLIFLQLPCKISPGGWPCFWFSSFSVLRPWFLFCFPWNLFSTHHFMCRASAILSFLPSFLPPHLLMNWFIFGGCGCPCKSPHPLSSHKMTPLQVSQPHDFWSSFCMGGLRCLGLQGAWSVVLGLKPPPQNSSFVSTWNNAPEVSILYHGSCFLP